MGLPARGRWGHFPVLRLVSLFLLTRTCVIFGVDMSNKNQPARIQCPRYENTYCNTTYQFCDQDNPRCLNCSDICYRLHEEPHHCRNLCPNYYRNAIAAVTKEFHFLAGTKLAEPTTHSFTPEQTDPGPTSPGSTENICGMSTGRFKIATIVLCILLSIMLIIIAVMMWVGCMYKQYRREKKEKAHTQSFWSYLKRMCLCHAYQEVATDAPEAPGPDGRQTGGTPQDQTVQPQGQTSNADQLPRNHTHRHGGITSHFEPTGSHGVSTSGYESRHHTTTV